MSNLPDLDDLCFYGYDGVESEDFVAAVRRMARKLNKQDDPSWVAAAIKACFEEEALRWHVSLEDDVKKDWDKLEKALLDRFPAPETRESRFITRKTTPAAAAATTSLVPTSRTGRIKIVQEDGGLHGYASKALTSGYVVTTTSVSDALVVQWTNDVRRLRMQNVTGNWEYLGVCWPSEPKAGSTSDISVLEGVKHTTSSFSAWIFRATGVWTLAWDGQIAAQWTSSSAQSAAFPLFSRVRKSDNLVQLVADNAAHASGTHDKVKMVLEEC